MSYTLEITVGENEQEFKVEIDAQVVENGFDHEFGFESCLDIEWNEVLSLEIVTKSTYKGLGEYSKRPLYDIETKTINFDKLRKENQEKITEAIDSNLESVTVSDFIDEQQDY